MAEFNESESPKGDGTQFYISSSADVDEIAKQIAAQMEINDREIKSEL
jgi:hypothetical protein